MDICDVGLGYSNKQQRIEKKIAEVETPSTVLFSRSFLGAITLHMYTFVYDGNDDKSNRFIYFIL